MLINPMEMEAAMAKSMSSKKKNRTLEQKHRELFPPLDPPGSTFPQLPAQPADAGYVIVNVTSYGGYQAPIEGWSILNAELGRGIK